MALARNAALYPWNNCLNQTGRLGGEGPTRGGCFILGTRTQQNATCLLPGRTLFLYWLALHLVSKARCDFSFRGLDARGNDQVTRGSGGCILNLCSRMTAGCGGVVGTNKQNGRGTVWQGSFPVQTAQLGIQSPQHLPPPTSKTGPS